MVKSGLKRICGSAVALSILCGVVLSGCSNSTAGSTSGASSSGKLSGTISVAGWNDAADALSAEAKAFMAENPGTTVNVQKVDGNYTKLYTELAAGSGVPDVVQMQNRDVQSFVNKYPDAWADVSDMMKSEESNFDSYVLNLTKIKGKYYAVPWDLGPCALYYRKDIFQQAGVDPSSIKTYDDYIAAGKKIVQATDGKTKLLGFDYSGSTSNDMLLLLLNQLGGQFYDSKGKVKLDSDEMVKAMNLCKQFISEGVSINLSNEWNDRITATENNQIATIPYAVWYAGTLESSNSDQSGKWGIIPLPAFTAGGNTQANEGGSALAISSKTSNAALAKAFVKFSLMSSEGNKINLDAGKLFTSYKKSYSDPEYKEVDSYFGVSVGATFAGLSDKIPSVTYGPYFTDVNNALKTAVGSILLKSGDVSKTLSDATASAQKAVDNE
ncbi:ABC transporter substrate-binding protein [Ethanoligenens harbinense]|uniref:Extracellular solute-binding protein family 1 n=1 Tax=Ethanoligenens harbinense (strain DSM 18485 / JCM 12961 / CGMCC 1.5033 / YUAN-3) TaxID=663278 RepID=E6U2N0_ETHHY|nr:sugar ABC transporter substrate-binding protein [Ethanoligenens harbinense]ADU26321.1 extracellular solute-binding protein family 1 [Ethanoligenens harbinense YUAN-3]AVQ95455.1 sugar ABC transporter substrate-binding protein [Ethanoligenens harbinense YUAN-3]AYF38119.1 sugar ABC transporter substrate-binding protein [Ethanoligenens harbinense]AYF40865.1 sugar ABC transporter substrate-binding protein [Ethanoligenens harbinense]QCN91695.1 sugar ABC transporter substrate-binding protein [Etha